MFPGIFKLSNNASWLTAIAINSDEDEQIVSSIFRNILYLHSEPIRVMNVHDRIDT
jgi:hypothetical protein